MKLQIENLTTLLLLTVILLAGCSGCAQKAAHQLPDDMPAVKLEESPDTLVNDNISETFPTTLYPPENPYADITVTGEQPPFPYYGNPLFWVPDVPYQTYDTPYEETLPILSYDEHDREYNQALQEYVEQVLQEQGIKSDDPRSENIVTEELKRKIMDQVFGKDMNMSDAAVAHLPPLDAAKCLFAIGSYSPFAKRMAQQALDENPNDFHTLLVWTEAQEHSSQAREDGFRQLLKMRPTSAYVLLKLAQCIRYENRQESIQLYKKAIQYAPQEEIGTRSHLNNRSIHIRDWALSELGRAYFWNDEKEKAIETFKYLADVTLYEKTRRIAQERIDEIKEGKRFGAIIFVDPDELYD